MRLPFTLILALLAYDSVFATAAKRDYSTYDYYVLEHNPLADASLADCASALGVEIMERAGELQNHWLVRAEKDISALDKRRADPVMQTLEEIQSRAYSAYSARSPDASHAKRIASAVRYLSPQTLRQRVKRAPPPPVEDSGFPNIAEVSQKMGIADPEFSRQWHIVNEKHPKNMMNVSGLWEMGVTGIGVIAALVDDGLDYTSEDLAPNFYAYGSHDFNDHTDLPTPVLSNDHHGTRCAGQIAAAKNDVCGVGIAYDSKVAGLRILSGPIADVDEAAALNYDFQNTSIYSCSWGPPDDGRSMEGQNYLIRKAMVNGIQHGREGKGSIFVFASGNGGRTDDQCNFDGYTNSIFSVTVAAVDHQGLHPDYSEACAANMVVAYSSGGGNAITTTDRGANKCAHTHGGTSAAAPNVAGVFALLLQVRPDLTWRDVQHLCVKSALKINPDDPDWEKTASGNSFSYKYGYGVVDAYKLVEVARDWQLVKPQAFVEMPAIQVNNGSMDVFQKAEGGISIAPGGVTSAMAVSQAQLDSDNLGKLEHITVKVWITHSRRGDVEVELISPNGVRSILAARRYGDSATTGYPGWTFMTVKHWDENPVGTWTLRVSDQAKEGESGVFLGWTMNLWGSVEDATKPVKIYDVPHVDTVLAPGSTEHTYPSTIISLPAATSTQYAKPTAHLPGDHDTSEGDASKPAFPGSGGKPAGDAQTSATSTPTPDEGWFADLSNLMTNPLWFFIAVGAVLAFGISAGIYFWRRRVRMRQHYTTLPASDDVAMSSIGGGGGGAGGQRTKELYDAFGEVSDDDEGDEETRLHARGPSPGVNLHTGFLDDDPSTAGMTPAPYRDEPDPATERSHEQGHSHERAESPASGSGSGDGSWEHASETR
ncbi:peptidase S8/S53 domain-containing protein [Rhodofomes roseus]|uniref:Peptidase S8/S53 domain-containing protein n=1 Tax=Rhodofomes roseus TaxID=34475 RepID=A0ABQ8KVP7_9APHY|nr:peptidase S8/S53 domain-containing protein [Rhodofomes roseus]KAH9843157.1 peptidase S8/S53 domain-containing protein [Rhodofomes roseus]